MVEIKHQYDKRFSLIMTKPSLLPIEMQFRTVIYKRAEHVIISHFRLTFVYFSRKNVKLPRRPYKLNSRFNGLVQP